MEKISTHKQLFFLYRALYQLGTVTVYENLAIDLAESFKHAYMVLYLSNQDNQDALCLLLRRLLVGSLLC